MKRTLLKISLTLYSLILSGIIAFAQGGLKITSTDAIEQEAKKGADTIVSIVKYSVGAALALSFLFVAYEVASGKQNARNHAIAWVIAVILSLVAFMVF